MPFGISLALKLAIYMIISFEFYNYSFLKLESVVLHEPTEFFVFIFIVIPSSSPPPLPPLQPNENSSPHLSSVKLSFQKFHSQNTYTHTHRESTFVRFVYWSQINVFYIVNQIDFRFKICMLCKMQMPKSELLESVMCLEKKYIL